MYNFGSYSGFLFSRMNGNLCTFDIYDLGNLSQKKTVKKETLFAGGEGGQPHFVNQAQKWSPSGHLLVTRWSSSGLLVVTSGHQVVAFGHFCLLSDDKCPLLIRFFWGWGCPKRIMCVFLIQPARSAPQTGALRRQAFRGPFIHLGKNVKKRIG